MQQRWWRLQRPREGNVVAAAAAAVRVLRPVAEAVQPPAWRPGPRSSNAISHTAARPRTFWTRRRLFLAFLRWAHEKNINGV
eukprot:SAG25_NODE_10995_length_317_cov_0.711009_1_plen_81_part_01